jgi:pimeloyl-ACP methyl ester carboxylesterase
MRAHTELPESAFPARRIGPFTYHTSRHAFDGASMMAYRFPGVDRTGPDFVLVHGIGVSARSYGPTAVALAAHGDVHLLDLPGYGHSPRPSRDLAVADHAAIVAEYVDRMELDHPVIVGHSMGTQVVAEMAALFPDHTDHIVLIAPVVVPAARSIAKAGLLLLKNAFREPPWVAVIAVHDYVFRAGFPYMAAQLPHLLGNDIEDVARRVRAKALVICGQDDPIVPLDWAAELTAAFPDGRMTVVPGPHATMFASPRIIADLIDEHAHR